MTIEEVAAAKAALEAEGTYPSHDAVLARVGHGSKRDIGRAMRALASEAPGVINRDIVTVDSEPEPSAEASQNLLSVGSNPSVSPEVVHQVDNYPLLAAYAACERAATIERTFGAEVATLKAAYQRITDPIYQLQAQLPYAPDDATVVRLNQALQSHMAQAHTTKALLMQLQGQRAQAWHHVMSTRETFADLQAQARAAIRIYQGAKATSETDPNALARHQARASMDTSYHILENLVGPEETRLVLIDGVQPIWFR